MSRVARWKTGNLQVIMHQLIRLGLRIIFPGEKLLLVVVAGSPRKYATDIQFFALYLSGHVFGTDPLRRLLVMRATGGVHVVVPGIPAILGRIDPSLHLEVNAAAFALSHL